MTGISVVIPTRERPQLLRRAVESAAGLEVVVVDDASGPETRRTGEELVARLGIRYLRLARQSGPGAARNLGVRHATGDLLLFLDDDDMILPGGADRIVAVADQHPEESLYLHNCVVPGGGSTLPPGDGTWHASYEDWLCGRWDGELKPVARRALFRRDAFDDTGAGGEGLLWGRVIRETGALVSARPVVFYDTGHGRRLTDPAELIRLSRANAAVAEAMLAEFGADLARVDPARHRGRVLAAVTYNVLSGRRRRALAVVRRHGAPLSRAGRALAAVPLMLPRAVLRALFLARAQAPARLLRRG
jgi:glycosyltransferase involved in cell wall biosynthesis